MSILNALPALAAPGWVLSLLIEWLGHGYWLIYNRTLTTFLEIYHSHNVLNVSNSRLLVVLFVLFHFLFA